MLVIEVLGNGLRFNMISLDFADLTTQLSGRDEASNQLNSELQNLKSQLAGMIFVKIFEIPEFFLNLNIFTKFKRYKYIALEVHVYLPQLLIPKDFSTHFSCQSLIALRF